MDARKEGEDGGTSLDEEVACAVNAVGSRRERGTLAVYIAYRRGRGGKGSGGARKGPTRPSKVLVATFSSLFCFVLSTFSL
jgi:hypothetical protein